MSDDVLYRHFLRHVAKYQEFAATAETSGNSSPFRHSFRRKLALNPNEEQDLNQVAKDYLTQVEPVQQQISAVIKTFRAAYPLGTLQPGVSLPPPPDALAPLVSQKRALAIAARDRLHTALGDEEFSRVDSLVRTQIAPQFKRAVIGQLPR